jgi:hypothetical protein
MSLQHREDSKRQHVTLTRTKQNETIHRQGLLYILKPKEFILSVIMLIFFRGIHDEYVTFK